MTPRPSTEAEVRERIAQEVERGEWDPIFEAAIAKAVEATWHEVIERAVTVVDKLTPGEYVSVGKVIMALRRMYDV